MIDSAQWWLYEQTSFRQLSEIYRPEEFMGPREARMQNEKEPPFPFLFHPQHLLFTYFAYSFRDVHFELSHYGVCLVTELCLVTQSSCGKYGVYNEIHRGLSESSRLGVGKGWLEWLCPVLKGIPAKGCLVWVFQPSVLTSVGSIVGKVLGSLERVSKTPFLRNITR